MEQCCLHHSAPVPQQLRFPASCAEQLILWVLRPLLLLLLFALVLGCQ
jgi:hypothetical protein